MSDANVEADAHEFGLHVKQGGWRLGMLVARNVERGKGTGDNQHTAGRNDRKDLEEKVSAKTFAAMSKTSAPRVLRFLDAWEKAAVDGKVPPPFLLEPGDNVDLDADKLPAWDGYYSASEGSGNTVSTKLVAQGIETATRKKLETAVSQLSDEAVEQLNETVEEERITRQLFPDKPKPTLEDAKRRQEKKSDEYLRQHQQEASIRMGARMGDYRARTRALAKEYRKFLALVDDAEILDYNHDRMVSLQADVNVAFGQVLEGSIDEAFATLLADEQKGR